ncbi:MAG: MgtC/SapB family protein [Polyangiaceae bacterium]|nr:MgtC/SapB family protein [Polyangiaceae bacterium]
MVSHVVLLGRIVLGTGLGAVIGYERDRHGRHVGLRTHSIVAMASATFMVVSAHFAYFQGYAEGQLIEVDGSRIAASVVSGIGFLAGGAILRTGITIQGLTTAAGLWLVTAIGLAAGGGMYWEAVVVTAMGTLALTVLRRFEDKNDALPQRRRITLVLAEGVNVVEEVEEVVHALGGIVSDVEYEQRLDDKPRIQLRLDVRLPANLRVGSLVSKLEAMKDVKRILVEHPPH